MRDANPGGPASTTIEPPEKPLVCQDPEGKPVSVSVEKTTGSVVIDHVRQSGFYRLYAGADLVASLPVNPHPDESDLRAIDPRELETKRQRQVSVMQAAGGGESLRKVQKGIDLWPYLIAFALASLLLEQGVRRVASRPMKRGIKR
jgi:hypothetical protein